MRPFNCKIYWLHGTNRSARTFRRRQRRRSARIIDNKQARAVLKRDLLTLLSTEA